ncbi:MAG: FprA family A-type flavoprotein [Bacteroidota bacterium]|nr:FprA family A-type flavoprotein [Bacteroidota bacterium]
MKPREIRPGVYWVGAIDWNRRLFDSLIPLPLGTSYNAYLIRGSERTVLMDTVDPTMEQVLFRNLEGVERLDYIVSHHAEQDHSGVLPSLMSRYSEAIVLCTPKAKPLLVDHLGIDPDRIKIVGDGETLDLGGKTLRFLHTPWVHWPETMTTHLAEDRILFSCDFFGSHLASSALFAGTEPSVYDAAKRYYAEIMMPFRKPIQKNIEKVRRFEFDIIAPSHGPVYDDAGFILSAYEEWVSDDVKNLVVIPYISMHGSTEAMVMHLVDALVDRAIRVHPFELTSADIGDMAMALVDAATLVLGTPTVLGGAHPTVLSAAVLTNLLRPKVRYAAVIGSYGWGSKAGEEVAGALSNLKVEVLEGVMCKGLPRADTYAALDTLADTIADKHAGLP